MGLTFIFSYSSNLFTYSSKNKNAKGVKTNVNDSNREGKRAGHSGSDHLSCIQHISLRYVIRHVVDSIPRCYFPIRYFTSHQTHHSK